MLKRGLAALLVLSAAFAVPTRAVAQGGPADPVAAKRDIDKWVSDQETQARASNKQLDFRLLMAERKRKAQDAVKAFKVESVEPAKCLALAQLYQIADSSAEARAAAEKFLKSSPSNEDAFTARQLQMWACQQQGDAKGLHAAILATRAPTPMNAAWMAAMMGYQWADLISEKESPQAALDLLAKLESQVPLDKLTSDQEKRMGDTALVGVASQRADLLTQMGKSDEALASLKAAKAKLGEGSPAARQLDSKIKLATIKGSPAPLITKEKAYGDFPGLDKWKGKVVLVDFTAHW